MYFTQNEQEYSSEIIIDDNNIDSTDVHENPENLVNEIPDAT